MLDPVLSMKLLQLHSARPGELIYASTTLGSMFHDSDTMRLDETYKQLAERGLFEPSGVIVSFFGMPKMLYRITPLGLEQVANAQSVGV